MYAASCLRLLSLPRDPGSGKFRRQLLRDLSALVVLVSMVVWGWLLGPVGALVSAPLTMVIKHSLAHSDQLRWIAELLGPTPKPTGRSSSEEADSADELSRA